MNTIRVAAIQLNARSDVRTNLERAICLITEAKRNNAQFVVLPELFLYRGVQTAYKDIACPLDHSAIVLFFMNLAKALKINILLGSILEISKKRSKFYNTSVAISEKGTVIDSYRKVHLFNAIIGGKRICESDYFEPGKDIISCDVSGVRIGIAICFDVRFPDLFKKLVHKGANIICLPSNFTFKTGEAHWHTLIKARAIETQRFIVAPNLCGLDHATNVKSFGHSLIVDPWGRIIAEAGEKEAVIYATLDLSLIKKTGALIPLQK